MNSQVTLSPRENKGTTCLEVSQSLSDLDKDFIAQNATLKRYRKGAYIYHNSRNALKIYLINQGKVKIGSYSEEGKEAISCLLTQRDIFGNVFGAPKAIDEFAQALSDVEIYIMSYPDFSNWLRSRPSNAEKILKLINRRFDQLEQKYLSIVLMDVKSRIIHFLKTMASTYGTEKGHYLAVPNFLTHQEIAEFNGTSRQTVTTIFIELKKKKLIDYNRSVIKIYPDFHQLR